MTPTLLRIFILITSPVFLSNSLAYGQNCTEQMLYQLQGTWIQKDRVDTVLVFITHKKFEFNYKGYKYWDAPYKLHITNKLPQIPDSISDCNFIELIKTTDTLYYKILAITDSTMSLMQYSIPKYSFFYADNDKPIRYVERKTFHYHKPKSLPQGYKLKTSVFGTWWDEATCITLKPDSTFSIAYSEENYVYSTCGKFRFNEEYFVLKDVRNKKQTMHSVDCEDFKNSIEKRWGVLENKYLLFDDNNEIHLYYGSLGLWLKERHMTLTKMR